MLRWISGLVLGSVLIGGALAPSTAQAGQWVDRGGYSYYVGDDGRWYYYDLAGNCYVWDGVAWRLYQPASRRYVEPYPADGYADYLDMVNARDSGVNGVKITYEECETGYNNDKGVECYERLKNKGPTGASLVDPLSTGITYALIERATADKIPVVSMGYGRADASYGAVFPYVFTLPTTYWSQADAFIKYIGQKEGGIEKLKGKKIGLVYIDIAYGKEPIATLEKLSQKLGFTFLKYPVSAPGIEQSNQGDRIRSPEPGPSRALRQRSTAVCIACSSCSPRRTGNAPPASSTYLSGHQ